MPTQFGGGSSALIVTQFGGNTIASGEAGGGGIASVTKSLIGTVSKQIKIDKFGIFRVQIMCTLTAGPSLSCTISKRFSTDAVVVSSHHAHPSADGVRLELVWVDNGSLKFRKSDAALYNTSYQVIVY